MEGPSIETSAKSIATAETVCLRAADLVFSSSISAVSLACVIIGCQPDIETTLFVAHTTLSSRSAFLKIE